MSFKTSKPGERVKHSGIYKATHDLEHCREMRYCYLLLGEQFPSCDCCREAVSYIQFEFREAEVGFTAWVR